MAEHFDPYFKWLGIPSEDQPPNHYRLLGIPLLVDDLDVISNAADRQMMMVRSFQTGEHSKDSQKLLNEIARAKVCLLNRQKKTEYDASLRPAAAEAGERSSKVRRASGLGAWATRRFKRPTPRSQSTPQARGLPVARSAQVAASPHPQIERGDDPLGGLRFEQPASSQATPQKLRPSGARQGTPPKVGRAAVPLQALRRGRNLGRIRPIWYAAGMGIVALVVLLWLVARYSGNNGQLSDSRGGSNAQQGQHDSQPEPRADNASQDLSPSLFLTPIPDQSLPPGALLRWKIEVRSPPGNAPAPELRLLNGPSGAELDSTSGQFRWQSRSDDANRTYTVRVQAQAGGQYSSIGSFQIQVGDGKSSVDLLKLIDPTLDSVAGTWRKEGGTLISPEDSAARIADPFAPPAEYRLRVAITRHTGADATVLGVVAGGKHVEVVLDGGSGESGNRAEDSSGINMIDGKDFARNETTLHNQQLLEDGKRIHIVVTVLRSKLTVERDGKKVIEWQADYSRCAPSNWSRGIADSLLYLGTAKSQFSIDEMSLEPVPDDGATDSDRAIAEGNNPEAKFDRRPGNSIERLNKGTTKKFTNSLGMIFQLIPAGEFIMGSPPGEAKGNNFKEQQHRVRITRPFYIATHEVSQRKYRVLMGNNPSYFSPGGGGSKQLPKNAGRLAVERVSWDDAQEFCQKLSKKEGKTYRLPTEAEWEYACRAGTTTAFSFGDTLTMKEANFAQSLKRTTHVDFYPPNAFGLTDMHGNVWEWCSDRFDEDYYEVSPVDDPQGPNVGSQRVLRGGSWDNSASGCRSARRYSADPELRRSNVGFRVVREP